jgi:hypothetical protein
MYSKEITSFTLHSIYKQFQVLRVYIQKDKKQLCTEMLKFTCFYDTCHACSRHDMNLLGCHKHAPELMFVLINASWAYQRGYPDIIGLNWLVIIIPMPTPEGMTWVYNFQLTMTKTGFTEFWPLWLWIYVPVNNNDVRIQAACIPINNLNSYIDRFQTVTNSDNKFL